MVADLWLSICCTTFTSEGALLSAAMLAAAAVETRHAEPSTKAVNVGKAPTIYKGGVALGPVLGMDGPLLGMDVYAGVGVALGPVLGMDGYARGRQPS
jgi:hypothetical protein